MTTNRDGCCTYHRTGGPDFVTCNVDEYEPEDANAINDENECPGSIRAGMQRYERNRKP